MKNIWNKEAVEKAIALAEQQRTEKGALPFPRSFLFNCGWDVECYQEYSVKYKLEMLKPEQMEVFALIKEMIDKILASVQALMLGGSITPAAYETTVREFETCGVSIKEQASKAKDRYDKLKRQQSSQVNKSGIKL